MTNFVMANVKWSAVLAGIVVFGNQLVPILPTLWANLLSAALALIALYGHIQVVQAARAAGVRGV